MSASIKQQIADAAVKFTDEHAQGFGDMVDQAKIFIPAAQIGARLTLNSPEVRAMREFAKHSTNCADNVDNLCDCGLLEARYAFDQLLREVGE